LRRDIETDIKEHFRLSFALQVKASYVLSHVGRAPCFEKSFVVKPERLIDDPFFWYFFGHRAPRRSHLTATLVGT